MKRIAILVSVLFVSVLSIAQNRPIVPRSSQANTVMDAAWKALYNMYVPAYADTTAANLQKGIDSCGAVIFTYNVNGFWGRQCSPKKWVRMGAVIDLANGLTLTSTTGILGGTLNQNTTISGSSTYYLTLDSSFLIVKGIYNTGLTLPNLGASSAMYFWPKKGAFRAMQATGTQLDAANIGSNSAAFGRDNLVSSFGFAAGTNNTLSGTTGFAAGSGNTISAETGGAAFGSANIVSNDQGSAFGASNTVAGQYSSVFGQSNQVLLGASYSTVSGQNNIGQGAYNNIFGVSNAGRVAQVSLFGSGLIGKQTFATYFGKYNDTVSTVGTIAVFGYGSSNTTRSTRAFIDTLGYYFGAGVRNSGNFLFKMPVETANDTLAVRGSVMPIVYAHLDTTTRRIYFDPTPGFILLNDSTVSQAVSTAHTNGYLDSTHFVVFAGKLDTLLTHDQLVNFQNHSMTFDAGTNGSFTLKAINGAFNIIETNGAPSVSTPRLNVYSTVTTSLGNYNVAYQNANAQYVADIGTINGFSAGILGFNTVGTQNLTSGQQYGYSWIYDSKNTNTIGLVLMGFNGTDNKYPITFLKDGKVGINKTAPAKQFSVDGTVRLTTLGTASSDTTTYKPLGISSAGDVFPMTYWPGGGGGGISTTLTNTHILVGNGSNVATDVAVSGDGTMANSGAITIASIGGKAVTLANSFTTSGNFALTLTQTGTTNVTLPTSGTLYGTATGSITSANLLGSLSDETGTGVAVFATQPTFTTSITSPLVIGGTGTTSSLTLKTTTGVGTTNADMIFLVGSNGGTEAMRIMNSGRVGINQAAPNFKFEVLENATTQTASNRVSYFTNTGATFNTTGGVLNSYAGYFLGAATRSSGSNVLGNYGVYAEASGGQTNTGLYAKAPSGAGNTAIIADGDVAFLNNMLLTGQFSSTKQTLTYGTTTTWNWNSGTNAEVTLTGNITTFTISNAVAGTTATIRMIQDGTGSRTTVLPGSSKVVNGGAGVITLSTAASSIDLLTVYYDGTNYYWTYGKNYN